MTIDEKCDHVNRSCSYGISVDLKTYVCPCHILVNSSNIGPLSITSSYQPYSFIVQLQTSNLNCHVMFTKYTIINIKESMTQVPLAFSKFILQGFIAYEFQNVIIF